jgi:hypothetical protein
LEESEKIFGDVLGMKSRSPWGIYRRVGREGERTAQREFNMNFSYACINFARESKR